MNQRSTQSLNSIGLESISMGESNVDKQVFSFIAKDKGMETPMTGSRRGRVMDGAPREKLRSRFPKQSPVPEGTVDAEQKLRIEILQLSLFPDIYTKVKRVQHPGNTDFGEPHDNPSRS